MTARYLIQKGDTHAKTLVEKLLQHRRESDGHDSGTAIVCLEPDEFQALSRICQISEYGTVQRTMQAEGIRLYTPPEEVKEAALAGTQRAGV